MRKQTDLAKVKQTALALLSTEINETPYSPMIVKHPFTDTGVSAIPDGKGGVEMIDLTEDDAQLRWRQAMARQIDKADSAYAIYMMVTKPYALTFLKFTMPHLSREDMSQILASAWTRSEAPHQDVNVTVNQLLNCYNRTRHKNPCDYLHNATTLIYSYNRYIDNQQKTNPQVWY